MLLRIFLSVLIYQLIGALAILAVRGHDSWAEGQICETGASHGSPLSPIKSPAPCDCCPFCRACGDPQPILHAPSNSIRICASSKEIGARFWDQDDLLPGHSRRQRARAPPV